MLLRPDFYLLQKRLLQQALEKWSNRTNPEMLPRDRKLWEAYGFQVRDSARNHTESRVGCVSPPLGVIKLNFDGSVGVGREEIEEGSTEIGR